MSRQAYVHKGTLLEGKGQSPRERVFILAIGLMALVLLVLGVVAVMRTSMSEDYRGLANFEGLPAASEFAGLHGVAAVRAADAAVSAARPAAASSLSVLRGVAAVRAVDAAVSGAASK